MMDGATMDRLALVDWSLHPDDPGPVPPGEDEDPDAAAGVDPRTGTPLEQSGVNVRLAP